MKLILFVFAGREYCMELQLPYILKILNRFPESEYHIWNFARNESDNDYLNTLPSRHDRIKIYNEFYQGPNEVTQCTKKPNRICQCTKCRVGKWSEPYSHYSKEEFKDYHFIKMDDDIVYIDLENLENYLNVIKTNFNSVISANVINNGLCAYFDPLINKKVISESLMGENDKPNKWFTLCTDPKFLELSHDCFFSNEFTKRDELEVFDDSKISINTIGFNYNVMCEVSKVLSNLLDKTHDEKVFSTHTKVLVYQNFITCHLHFSDQNALITDEIKTKYIQKYKELCGTII